MITHTLKPGKLIAQISDIFTEKGFRIPQIEFKLIFSTGDRLAYGFWITGANAFGFAETRELIELFERYKTAERYCDFCFMIGKKQRFFLNNLKRESDKYHQ